MSDASLATRPAAGRNPAIDRLRICLGFGLLAMGALFLANRDILPGRLRDQGNLEFTTRVLFLLVILSIVPAGPHSLPRDLSPGRTSSPGRT